MNDLGSFSLLPLGLLSLVAASQVVLASLRCVSRLRTAVAWLAIVVTIMSATFWLQLFGIFTPAQGLYWRRAAGFTLYLALTWVARLWSKMAKEQTVIIRKKYVEAGTGS